MLALALVLVGTALLVGLLQGLLQGLQQGLLPAVMIGLGAWLRARVVAEAEQRTGSRHAAKQLRLHVLQCTSVACGASVALQYAFPAAAAAC